MTDEQVKQAIGRHGLSVCCTHKSKTWLVHYIVDHPWIEATGKGKTLTEAVAELVRQIEAQQKENANG